jgi:LysM repeat protein
MFLLLTPGAATAQDGETDGPYYIVQAGDSLWDIAARFGVPLDELMRANGIDDPDRLDAGARLLIPGLGDFSGRVGTQVIPYGETLHSLSRSYQVQVEILVRLNRWSVLPSCFRKTVVVLAELFLKAGKCTRLARTVYAGLAVLNNADPGQ